MFSDLPVAGSDIPGLREAAGEAGSGYLAPPADASALAKILLLISCRCHSFTLETAVRITQSNGATEKSRPYIRNSIHQKGESQKGFFKKILLCFFSVAPLLRVSTAFFRFIAVCVGRLFVWLLPGKNRSGLFFFFPFCHIGGAERVHADIVACFAPERPWVFFCKWSPRPAVLRYLFDRSARVFNWRLRLKYSYPFSAWIMAGVVNRHPNAVVFGCNTLFFYKMVPYLAAHVRVVDLLHAFGGGAEEFSLPVVQRIDARVVITPQTRDDLIMQYHSRGLDDSLAHRIELIENRVDIPAVCPVKAAAGVLEILFVGRNSVEKRVHLAGRVAALCTARGVLVRLTMVGDVMGGVAEIDRPLCTFTGEVTDQTLLKGLYERAHLLLLTSSREGFPLVIMEAMAQGAVPLATDVGGIALHLQTGANGWLIEDSADEEIIAEAMCAAIEKLAHDREELSRLSGRAYDYARENFGGERFCRRYRSILAGHDNDNNRGADA
ncbi:MAG: glycosyltransferase [Desulfuromonadaceae bacterium]